MPPSPVLERMQSLIAPGKSAGTPDRVTAPRAEHDLLLREVEARCLRTAAWSCWAGEARGLEHAEPLAGGPARGGGWGYGFLRRGG